MMFLHPAFLMLIIWGSAALSFFSLPYKLTDRSFSVDGLLGLFLFVFAFCFGALLKTASIRVHDDYEVSRLDINTASSLLGLVGQASILLFVLDILQHGGLSMGELATYRDMQAQALLHGGPSASSIPFKLAFLIYPASYSYVALNVIAVRTLNPIRIAIWGLMPSLLASVAMGGRMPLLCSLIVLAISAAVRIRFKNDHASRGVPYSSLLPIVSKVGGALVGIAALVYFGQVFVARAEMIGGVSAMLAHASERWGVTFDGIAADTMLNWLGDGVTYLVFVFSWYFNQGVLMADQILASYQGGLLFGAYGVDLVSAVLRRVRPDWLSAQFEYLLALRTYGFYPSAYGSLYIDFGYWGLLLSFTWGWLSGLVYEKVNCGCDHRYRILYPFMVMGILLSLINTPLGVGNGLMIYVWLMVAFFLTKCKDVATISREAAG